MVEVPDLFLRGLVSYKLHGRYVPLGIWPWQAVPPALVNEPLCFLLPLLSGVQEHTVEDDGLVRPLYTPSGVFVEEHFGIKPMFCLSNGQPCFPCLLLRGLGLVQFVSVMQLK